jgi:hypothetical protein
LLIIVWTNIKLGYHLLIAACWSLMLRVYKGTTELFMKTSFTLRMQVGPPHGGHNFILLFPGFIAVVCETAFEIAATLDFFSDNNINLLYKIVVSSQFNFKESPETLYDNCVDVLLARSNTLEPAIFEEAEDSNMLRYTSYTNPKTLKFQVSNNSAVRRT